MNATFIKQARTIALALVAVGATTATATAANQGYCDPLNGCASLKVSPKTVARGHVVTVSGSVAGGCQTPGVATVYSRAFAHATKHEFAGVPAIFPHTKKNGHFSTTVRISRRVRTGRYHVGGRCGGGNFGSATLRVS